MTHSSLASLGMFVAWNVTLTGLTRTHSWLYTVNDFSQLCFGSQMTTLWGAEISLGIEFPAAKAGRLRFALLREEPGIRTRSNRRCRR